MCNFTDEDLEQLVEIAFGYCPYLERGYTVSIALVQQFLYHSIALVQQFLYQ